MLEILSFGMRFQLCVLLGSETMFITADGLSVAGVGEGCGRGAGVEACRTVAPSRYQSLAAHPGRLTRVKTDQTEACENDKGVGCK